MKKRLIALVVAPIVGAVIGYLLAEAMNNGWFSSKWQRIENPPDKVDRLVAVSKGSLWIESDSGVFYYSENPSSCKSDCWQKVSEIPSLPVVEPYEASVSATACAPSPPLGKVTATMSECRIEMWVDRNATFALRNDGSIYLWKADLYKEWSAVLIILSMIIGAIALFVFTLIVMFINWLLSRTHAKQREKPSAAA